MKKLTLLTLTLGLVASSAFAQSSGSDDVKVGVSIGSAIVVTKTADLFFGTHDGVIDSLDIIEVDIAGGIGTNDLGGIDVEEGIVTVEGAFNAEVFVTLSGTNYDEVTGILQLVDDGGLAVYNQDVELLVGAYSGAALADGTASFNLDAFGDLSIGIGGTLTIRDTTPGFYRGEVTFTVSYF